MWREAREMGEGKAYSFVINQLVGKLSVVKSIVPTFWSGETIGESAPQVFPEHAAVTHTYNCERRAISATLGAVVYHVRMEHWI